MRAFVTSLVLMAAITAAAAAVLGTMSQSSREAFTATDNVRL
ncbi:MAG: hypothetical protein NW217_05570 [Hyphomicrobiaceae bacterium]|nr:hypothetical protein [Hyphomicrobiaceae bacterium]